jgi:hypothetical protein
MHYERELFSAIADVPQLLPPPDAFCLLRRTEQYSGHTPTLKLVPV